MPDKKATTKKSARKPAVVTVQDLLIEIGTEELPPKALKGLSEAFCQQLFNGLAAAALVSVDGGYDCFAAPRRLAVRVHDVLLRQPDRIQERRGPAVKAAYDDQGKPTKALEGFARSCGVRPDKLETVESDKGAWLVFQAKEQGKAAADLIPAILDETLKRLPIPKRMRWGDLEAEFVRPVHWVVMLHGDKPIKTEVLSVQSGRVTRGHRFHYPKPITLKTAAEYERALKKTGMVLAGFSERRDKIREGVEALAASQQGMAAIKETLLDEVTSLVEWPEPILGEFDRQYLEVPAEALVTTMQDNQKYFPVTDKKGRLLPYFITVSNVRSRSKVKVQQGNERVLRARFADARFFWETDRKTRLADRADGLKHVVFHVKLGSVYDKTRRVGHLAALATKAIGGDPALAERAAHLAKADLLSGMVGEFPELQGIMGRYYAAHDGEPAEVAAALEEQYRPRFAGDGLPKTPTGQALAIADKLDTLVGIFGVGEVPSGDKDPFALRRAALGVLRIIIEGKLELDVMSLLRSAAVGFETRFEADAVSLQVYDFMMERLRAYYADAGISHDVVEAVIATRPARPFDFDKRVRAVMAFRKLKEAESLTAANKRIANILKQGGKADWDHVSEVLLQEPAEKSLAVQVAQLQKSLAPLFESGDYTKAMKQLAGLRPQVDGFFDQVMVMVDEEAVRDNRLALLSGLSKLFLRVADLSKLQG